MGSSIRVCCRRWHCIPSLNAGNFSACGMKIGPMKSPIFVSAVILSLGSHASTSYPFGTGRLASLSLTRYASLTNLRRFRSNKHLCKLISQVNFSSFDFLDEHHILYAVSDEDSIYVYDLHRGQQQQKQPQKEKEKEIGPLRFHLALPPINRSTTSRYIQLRRNALPTATGPLPDWRSWLDGSGIAPGPGPGPATPPFNADPHERLIVVRIATSPVEGGEEQFELHVRARAFLEHFSSSAATTDIRETRQRDDGGECKDEEDNGVVVVPWTAWRNAVSATPPRKLPYATQARMIVYGMRVVSYPPDWDEGVLHIDSYLPRARRREGSREAGADTGAEAAEAQPTAGARGYGTRQSIRLPREVEDKPDFLTALCEDALLCYKVNYRTRTGLFFLQYRMPDGICHRLIHCRTKSRMHIGTPFKMGNKWVLKSAFIIGGPFAAPSFVRCYCIRFCSRSYCSHIMLSTS